MIWSTQFHGLEARLTKLLSGLGRRWLLDLPLALFVLGIAMLGWKGKKSSFLLTPLVLLGLTTITAEILAIFAFQTLKGYLYQNLALLFSAFMLGIVLGALRRIKRKRNDYSHLVILQVLFVSLLVILWLVLSISSAAWSFYLFLFLLGFLGGDLFVLANVLFLQQKTDYGIGYGLDLLGGFLGALGTSSVLVPLLGIPAVLGHLILANIGCLCFLLWGKIRFTT
jgi:peptidoglycan/LPS O-acetylase OafA/YrhL